MLNLPEVPHKMLSITISLLEKVAIDLRQCEPPVIPYDSVASARGWSIRLVTIREKLIPFNRAEVLAVCSRLTSILCIFDSYISAWDAKVAEVDPVWRDYKFMPGDFDAVDSIRLMAERVNLALYECFSLHFMLDEEETTSESNPSSVAEAFAGERVPVYDFKTKIISTIPAEELAAGMVQMNIRQDDGSLILVWVNSEELKLNTYQHPPFEQEVRDRFNYLKTVLDDVYPNSIDEWEDLFRRDKDWQRELSVWLRIARVYDRLANGFGYGSDRKRDIYKVLLTCTMAPRDHVIGVLDLDVLTKAEALEIVNEFFETSEQ